MTERVNKLYKPAELVAAIDAVRNAVPATGFVINHDAADIVKSLYKLDFRIVYVGKVDDCISYDPDKPWKS